MTDVRILARRLIGAVLLMLAVAVFCMPAIGLAQPGDSGSQTGNGNSEKTEYPSPELKQEYPSPEIPQNASLLKTGSDINALLGQLGTNTGSGATQFKWSMSANDGGTEISKFGKPVYAKISNDKSTIFFYSDASRIYANKDSSGLLVGFSDLKNADALIAKLDTSYVTDMSLMFDGCDSLSELDVSGFDTSATVDMKQMFDGCKALTALDLSSFDTSNVTNADKMFDGCSGLTSIKTPKKTGSQEITLPASDFYELLANGSKGTMAYAKIPANGTKSITLSRGKDSSNPSDPDAGKQKDQSTNTSGNSNASGSGSGSSNSSGNSGNSSGSSTSSGNSGNSLRLAM